MAGLLLDTNVISESMQKRPSTVVLAWLADQQPEMLYLAATTLGEVVRGAVRLPDGARRRLLLPWARDSLPATFKGRILPFDQPTAIIWGEILGEALRQGRPRPAMDMQIA